MKTLRCEHGSNTQHAKAKAFAACNALDFAQVSNKTGKQKSFANS